MERDQGRHGAQYLSFLLRLWRVGDEEALAWCGSLQRPGAAELVGFARVEDLFDYLRAEMGAQDPPLARHVEAPLETG